MPYTENYNTDPVVAFEGMVADQSLATIVSRTVQTANLGMGRPVKHGSAEHTVANVATGDTAIYGISVRSQATPAENTDVYPVGDTAAILLKGTVWVKVNSAVLPNDPVFVTVNGGAFEKAAAAGRVQIAGATYETAAGANGLSRVRIV